MNGHIDEKGNLKEFSSYLQELLALSPMASSAAKDNQDEEVEEVEEVEDAPNLCAFAATGVEAGECFVIPLREMF